MIAPVGCDLRLETALLRWTDVGVGYEAEKALQLHNDGDAACAVTLATDGAGFRAAPVLLAVEPRSSSTVTVTWRPEQAGLSSGVLHLELDEGSFTVPLEGEAMASCLALVQASVDFGEAALCAYGTAHVTILNDCSHVVQIEEASTTDPGESTFGVRRRPTDLAPYGDGELELAYWPGEVGSDAGELVVVEGNGATVRIPLRGSGTIDTRHTDRFSQPVAPTADLLFVIDDSQAMAPYHTEFDGLISRLIDCQTSEGAHFRWGVTTTSRSATDGCAGSGADGRLFPFDGSGPRWLDADDAPPDAAYADLFDVPACSTAPNEGFAAAIRAVTTLALKADDPDHPEPADGNSGFVRHDAALAVFFLSARDDASPQSIAEARDQLLSVHGFRNSNLLKVFAGVLPPDGCAGTAGVESTRYAQLADTTGGDAVSLCDPGSLADLVSWGSNGWRPTSNFYLPNLVADADGDGELADGIEVSVDDELYPAVDDEGVTRWLYDAGANAIRFQDGFRPAEGAEISITYPIACR